MRFKNLLSAALSLSMFASVSHANHPVLVDGNSDSPVPGTTIVSSAGTSGDFDGDGRIGTAEDTDGADRIFGTLNAALGSGTGAAASTGVNFNGTLTIVGHGRFAEALLIERVTPGNITIEAAPGIHADLDAVLQGDPAGLNNVRQLAVGITIDVPPSCVVTIRNLKIRNWATGILIKGASRVNLENCVFENNRDYGVRVLDSARVRMSNCQVLATGFRVGTAVNTPTPGIGIEFARGAKGFLFQTSVNQSFGLGLKTAGRVSRSLFTQFDNNRGAE